jgi:hypothetical protein
MEQHHHWKMDSVFRSRLDGEAEAVSVHVKKNAVEVPIGSPADLPVSRNGAGGDEKTTHRRKQQVIGR